MPPSWILWEEYVFSGLALLVAALSGWASTWDVRGRLRLAMATLSAATVALVPMYWRFWRTTTAAADVALLELRRQLQDQVATGAASAQGVNAADEERPSLPSDDPSSQLGALYIIGTGAELPAPPLPPPHAPMATGKASSQSFAPTGEMCSPSATDQVLASSAARVREALELTEPLRQTDPWWPTIFWAKVSELERVGALHPEVTVVLRLHGSARSDVNSPPAVAELTRALKVLETGGPGKFARSMNEAAVNFASWSTLFLVGQRRAAPEIYKNILSAGFRSVREWLRETHKGDRTSAIWTDAWAMACAVDLHLGPSACNFQALAKEDVLELQLRHLAAMVFERRTGDRRGAVVIRAVTAPGSSANTSPAWLVAEASVHSLSESRRAELMEKEVFWNSRRSGKGYGKSDAPQVGEHIDGGKKEGDDPAG